MMTHFRKRIPADTIRKINEMVFCPEALELADSSENTEASEDDSCEESEFAETSETSTENCGTLIIDATCCPADIHYHTDIGLLSRARELVEHIIDILHPSVLDAFPHKPRMYRQVARKNYLAYSKKRSLTSKETRNCVRLSLQ